MLLCAASKQAHVKAVQISSFYQLCSGMVQVWVTSLIFFYCWPFTPIFKFWKFLNNLKILWKIVTVLDIFNFFYKFPQLSYLLLLKFFEISQFKTSQKAVQYQFKTSLRPVQKVLQRAFYPGWSLLNGKK